MVASWLGATFLSPPSAEAQSEEELTEARTEFERGRRAYDAGDFEQALEAFQRAHVLTESPDILYNLATVADRLRRDELALHAYERYLSHRPDAPDRKNVEARIAALRESIAHQREAEAAVPPGDRRMRGRVAPASAEATGDLDDGVDPAGDTSRGRLYTWIAAGTSGALFVTAGVFGVRAKRTYDDLEGECAAVGCTAERIDDSGGPRDKTLTNVFLGLGGAALVTAAVLFFVEGGDAGPERGPAVGLGPTGLSVTGRF